MRLALQLARKGGRTSPNPPVGAVLVKNNKILATGFHRGPGTDHAEAAALKKLKGRAQGATLFVTLEPCCHTEKRTPPCVRVLLESGIKRVVVGHIDPNPQVNGRGIRTLRSQGIQVQVGCLAEECHKLIQAYGKWIVSGIPFIILKSAMTLDGKIATVRGESHWITGEFSRRMVHELRSRVDAVMVGFETVMKDNPELTVRSVSGPNPIRVVLDSHLRLPLNRKIFSRLKEAPTVVATLLSEKDNPKVTELQKKGAHLIFCGANRKGRVDLEDLFLRLGNRGITSVMVEGGATLASSLIEQGELDELWLFVAPRVLGGSGLDWLGELQVGKLKSTSRFELLEAAPSGEDFLFRLRPWSSKS